MTMIKIATIDVGAGGAASIVFSSIPSTYTDLQIVASTRDTTDIQHLILGFNGSGSGFTMRQLYGSGSAAASGSRTDSIATFTQNPSAATANTFNNFLFYIPNYAGSTNKSYSVDSVTENNATTAYQNIMAGLWSNTAAINSVGLYAAGTLAQYSTASLYGITKGSGGATVS